MKQILTMAIFASIAFCAEGTSLFSQSIEKLTQDCNVKVTGSCDVLGFKYHMKKDYFNAAKYYTKGCEQNFASSCYELARMYSYGTGVKKDMIKAKKLFKKACNRGYKEACENASTTYSLMDSQKLKITKAEAILNKYFTEAKKRYSNDTKLISLMMESQKRWLSYRKSECSAVHQIWIEGSIRGLMAGQCVLDMTKRRTHEIWETYLTYGDSTPAILKEPK